MKLVNGNWKLRSAKKIFVLLPRCTECRAV